MGIIQNFSGRVLGTLAPLVPICLATNFVWRNAFFIAGVPDYLC